jgi:hypothetical protein
LIQKRIQNLQDYLKKAALNLPSKLPILNEAIRPNAPENLKSREDRRNVMCRNIRFGKTCRFYHPVCRFYLGKACKFGEKCINTHPLPDSDFYYQASKRLEARKAKNLETKS